MNIKNIKFVTSSENMGKRYLSLFLLLSTTKNPDIVYKTKIRFLETGEKKVDQLETLGSEEWHTVVCSLGFLLALYISNFEWKTSDPEISIAQPKRSPDRTVSSLAKGLGKDQLAWPKAFR